MEHFESYITEKDVAYISSLGMDHIRLGFDQIVLEESPYRTDTEKKFLAFCTALRIGVKNIICA